MTPYEQEVDYSEFYNGATFVIEQKSNTAAWLSEELERLSNSCNINTITVYGLESVSDNIKAHLFNELKRLGMQIVVRIESYDGRNFAFTEADANHVAESHRNLVEFVSQPAFRDCVAYFALNMPVDDTQVQKNCGGLNTKKWKDSQVTYAETIVRLMREMTAGYGFTDSKMFLSVFYGWDNSFDILPYTSANADGYFINNYSYPKSGVPGPSDSDDILINASRLAKSMQTYTKQYGNAPVVMEFGFHTVEYNNGKIPNQTAGLVSDRVAKEKAMKATIRYYQDNWPAVRGSLYFGYNLLKEEGNPPAIMDWCLVYPSEGTVRAVDASMSGSAMTLADSSSILLSEIGDSVSFRQCPQLQQVAIKYKADTAVSIELLSDGRLKKAIELPVSEHYTTFGIPIVVVEDNDLVIRLASTGRLIIDSVTMCENLEAEFAENAERRSIAGASLDSVAVDLNGRENAITFRETRGGQKITLNYMSKQDSNLYIELDGKRAKFPLAASTEWKTVTATLPLYRDSTFSIYSDSPDLMLDYICLTGIPGRAN